MRFNALIFDVFGTVVDEAGTIAAEVSEAVPDAGALAERWTRRFDHLMDEVRGGTAPWRTTQELRRAALFDALDSFAGSRPPVPVVERLARVGHRMKPWPDSPDALRILAGAFTVVALSNGTMAELADLSAAGGLSWHCVLSAEQVKAYKPDPAVYRLALDLLELDPSTTLMVAAHPWDKGARSSQHGHTEAGCDRGGVAGDLRSARCAGIAITSAAKRIAVARCGRTFRVISTLQEVSHATT